MKKKIISFFSKKKRKNTCIIFSCIVLLFISLGASLTKLGYIPNFFDIEILCHKKYSAEHTFGKPVIYLYPEKPMDVQVKLDLQGKIIADYPKYDEKNGWNVTAFPDGKILNISDKKEYSYLFWEGIPDSKIDWDLSSGFIVRGEDSRDFLQNILSQTGLTPKEYNEFVVYWYPILQQNPYNLIHFSQEQYNTFAPLSISPAPDSLLRVFMVYKPLKKAVEIQKQVFQPFTRKGFTVIEWGGTQAQE